MKKKRSEIGASSPPRLQQVAAEGRCGRVCLSQSLTLLGHVEETQSGSKTQASVLSTLPGVLPSVPEVLAASAQGTVLGR